MCLLIAKPDYFLQSATAGLALFATSVLPAVFPFFFCATLLTAMGASTSVARLGAKPVRMLFNAAPEGAYVLLLSMLSGYPIGAATIADLYKNGMLNTEEAIRDLSVRLSIKLNALRVTSGLPGPCRSVFKKKSQIKFTSNPRIVLLSLFIIVIY